MSKIHRIAILNNEGYLVDYQNVEDLQEGDVEVGKDCDLPVNGTYKYNSVTQQFFPLGTDFKKPVPPPFSNERALYLLTMAMPNPTEELVGWATWYRNNLGEREREEALYSARQEQPTDKE